MNRDRDDKTIIRVRTRAQVLLFRRTLLSSRSFLTYPTFSASFLPRTLGSCRVVAPLLLLPSPRLRFREPLSLSFFYFGKSGSLRQRLRFPGNKPIKRAILEKKRKERKEKRHGKRGQKLVVADGTISAGRQAPHERRVSWSNWPSVRFQSCCCCCCCCESPRFEALSLSLSLSGSIASCVEGASCRRGATDYRAVRGARLAAPSPCTLSVHVLPAAHNKLPFFSHLPSFPSPSFFFFLPFFSFFPPSTRLPPSASNPIEPIHSATLLGTTYQPPNQNRVFIVRPFSRSAPIL